MVCALGKSNLFIQAEVVGFDSQVEVKMITIWNLTLNYQLGLVLGYLTYNKRLVNRTSQFHGLSKQLKVTELPLSIRMVIAWL